MKQNFVKKPLPPDGGWGWVICIGCSLITLSLRSLDPSFGLLFGDLLRDLKIDSTRTSLIMSVLDANINFSGLFVGYLLTKYSYRKVAFFGALLNSTGLILTSQANSLTHIVLTYSIIGGIGTGLALASSFVALNSFFVKKRGQALGFSMAGTTMGMMLMPQIVQILLEIYGFRGTTLIIGGISLHSLIGACLLSPVPLKKVEEKLSESENSFSDEIAETSGENNPLLSDNNETTIQIPLEATNKNGALKLNENLTKNPYERRDETRNMRKSYLKKIKDFFGLHLLTNRKFLNVMIGVSLFYVAETNFKLFTPFFLFSIGMTKKEVAFCLSLTAFMDVLARLALPTLFDKLGFKKRTTFWICALCIAIGRSVFAEESNSLALIVTLVIVGFLRGSTIVNMNLTISEQCTLEMLPHAYGIFMVFKGTFVVFFSPAIGFVRDMTSSYRICIHLMSGVIFFSIAIWGVEYLCEKLKSLMTKKKEANLSEYNKNYRTFQ